MKPFLFVAASLLSAHAMRGESFTVGVQEIATIEIAGATAAYTTNPLIADVTTARAGRLTITGHTSGTTQLMVITASGTQSFLITVAAPSLPSAYRPEAGAPLSRYDGLYSSGNARLQNALDFFTNDGKRRSEFHVLHIHYLRADFASHEWKVWREARSQYKILAPCIAYDGRRAAFRISQIGT